ncbi:MAG: acetate--CoA ligase family protein [Deltaproteobacteria bacterium]|nr:acetate--CoA ligase family protein [Deltaproteobacteria bacterium]
MDTFFHAASVAVIGVSPRPQNLGRRIVMNLQRQNYNGVIYAVGPRGGTFLGHYIYKSVEEIERPVELAVILTPAPTVPETVRSCGRAGIKRIVIESGGFAELGPEGDALTRALDDAAREFGIRFVGPNGIGTFNVANGLCVGFPIFPLSRFGGTSIVTQSGGVGLTYLVEFESESVGVSKFTSVGNKLNIDEVDLLEYLRDDPATERMVFYLESFSRAREFCRLAATSDKPIIVHKSNTSALSQSIAASHTTAMLSDDRVADAALRQAGVIRTATIRGALDAAKICSLPPMKGPRMGIVSRSGGHAVIATDTCAARGFPLPEFDPRVLELAQRHVRAGVIKLQNPLDLGDLFEIDTYKEILADILSQPQIDGVVFLLVYHSLESEGRVESLIDHVDGIVKKHRKPIALVLQSWPEEVVRMKKYSHFPIFATAEEAVEALYVSRKRYRGLQRRTESIPKIRVNRKETAAILTQGAGKPHLGRAAFDVLERYGIPVVETRFAQTATEAAAHAKEIGFPVVLKTESPQAVHKTDVDGVALGLTRAADVKQAFADLKDGLARHVRRGAFEGAIVQPMAPRGLELFVGGTRDRDFGPVIVLGWGGTVAEALGPPIIRLAPISKKEALRMIDELPARRLLDGIRKYPAMDLSAIADLIVRASLLIAEQGALAEMDLNPVRLYAKGKGALVLDARMIVRS